MPVETFFVPGVEGLAAEVRRDIHAPANDLAAFDRDVDLTAALVAGHGVEFCFESLVHKFRK